MSDLERRLIALGATLDVPPAPDLVGAVRARIATSSSPAPARRRRSRPRRTTVAIAFGLVLALAGSALAITPVRHAIEDVFDLRDAHVRRVPVLPPAPTARLRGAGRPIPVARARHAAAFTALLPTPAATAAYLGHDVPGGRITLTRGRILITEFRGRTGLYLQKVIGMATRVRRVHVGPARALWLEGPPHVLFLTDARGAVSEETVRRAGNVLLWEHGGLILRVEGARSLTDALRIARSLR